MSEWIATKAKISRYGIRAEDIFYKSKKTLRELNRMNNVEHSAEYIYGMADCRDGKAHGKVNGYSESQQRDYDRGYSAQYEWEQVKEVMTR